MNKNGFMTSQGTSHTWFQLVKACTVWAWAKLVKSIIRLPLGWAPRWERQPVPGWYQQPSDRGDSQCQAGTNSHPIGETAGARLVPTAIRSGRQPVPGWYQQSSNRSHVHVVWDCITEVKGKHAFLLNLVVTHHSSVILLVLDSVGH